MRHTTIKWSHLGKNRIIESEKKREKSLGSVNRANHETCRCSMVATASFTDGDHDSRSLSSLAPAARRTLRAQSSRLESGEVGEASSRSPRRSAGERDGDISLGFGRDVVDCDSGLGVLSRGSDGVLRNRSAMGVRVVLDGEVFEGDERDEAVDPVFTAMRGGFLWLSAVLVNEFNDNEDEDESGVDNGLEVIGTLSDDEGAVVDGPTIESSSEGRLELALLLMESPFSTEC